MNERNEGLELDLRRLFKTYLQKWWLFVIAAVVIGAGAYAYTHFFITNLYTTSTTIYVNNFKEDTKQDSVSSSNLSASARLVSTYINIVKSNRVMEKASEQLNGEYSPGAIAGMVSAKQVDETEIFAIYVTGPVPEETAKIANVLAEVVPAEIGALIEGSSARVIDYAKIPVYRSYPSYRRNTVIGAAVGIVIVLIYLTLRFIFDVRIKSDEELSAMFGLPVLGQIPEFSSTSKGSGYYGRSRKKADPYADTKKEEGVKNE